MVMTGMAGMWFSAPRVHLVFVRKYRRGVFGDGMLRFCEEVMGKVCGDFEANWPSSTAGPTK